MEKSSQRRKTPDIVQVSQTKEKDGSMHMDIMNQKYVRERKSLVWYVLMNIRTILLNSKMFRYMTGRQGPDQGGHMCLIKELSLIVLVPVI